MTSQLEFLKQEHIKGRISRREFLGRAAAAGATVAVLGDLVASVEAHAAETPTKGGTLRLGLGGGSTTDSLDPTSYNDSVNIDVSSGYFNALVETGPQRQWVPELAESWEAKSGAREWVFNLRKGVEFHNGKTFDADDAVYSLNLHRGKTKSGAAGSFKGVTDVKKLSPNQILVTLELGDAEFPAVLTDYHAKMVPNGFTDFSKAVGTGGYKVDHYDPGVRATGVRNPNYWRASERAHVDSFDLTVINDTSARMTAMLSGQVDAINRVDTKQAGLLKRKKNLALVVAPGGYHNLVSMMQDRAPFDSLDLRLAFKYAVERPLLVKVLFSGYGTVGNDHPIPKGDPDYPDKLQQITFDPEKAKFHLKKSGFTGTIVLDASDAVSGGVDMSELMQASAKKVGLNVEVKKQPADGFWDNVWLKHPCVTSYWGGRTTALQMLKVAYAPDAPWNESHYKNPKFAELLNAAGAELDDKKRRELVIQAATLLHDDGASIIPVFRDWVDAHNVKVGGHTPHTLFDMDNGYIIDKAWIKS